ncbi:MAG: hypothetical protein SGI73_04650 [Chloroflexota bacterium]|nr:hypothetical protein [Chloroflexota bacterium]
MDWTSFADRIRTHYENRLTAIFAIGGTRTSYILKYNRTAADPGAISDLMHYARWTTDQYFKLVEMFFDLGGQNFITPALAYQRFDPQRGDHYTQMIADSTRFVFNDKAVEFYHAHNVDPYFAGIDTLLHFPERTIVYQLGLALQDFQKNWNYQPGRKTIIWEIAPISMFSIQNANWSADEAATAALNHQLQTAPDLESIAQLLYRHYARILYGVELPMPQVYIGTNRNGDLKLRAIIPLTLYAGSPMRLYYTPYPSLFLTHEALAAILEDAAFGKTLSARTTADYTGQFTPNLAEAEYQRIMALAADPSAIVGWTRKASSDDD